MAVIATMKKLPLILAAMVLLAVSSCKKDNPEEEPQTYQYLPAKAGSWWAYVLIQHDGQGGSSVMSRDTLHALGTTIIDGETFNTFMGSLLVPTSNSQPWYVRDSSNYLINDHGFVILPYLNFTDTFNRVGPELNLRERYQKLYQDPGPLTINAGTFNTIDFRTEVVFEQTSPCGTDMGFSHQQFTDNVGMVRATYWYASTYGCNQYVERKLEAYHIEE